MQSPPHTDKRVRHTTLTQKGVCKHTGARAHCLSSWHYRCAHVRYQELSKDSKACHSCAPNGSHIPHTSNGYSRPSGKQDEEEIPNNVGCATLPPPPEHGDSLRSTSTRGLDGTCQSDRQRWGGLGEATLLDIVDLSHRETTASAWALCLCLWMPLLRLKLTFIRYYVGNGD